MRNRAFRALVNCKIPMNLQLFAESNPEGTENNPSGGSGSNEPGEGDNKPAEKNKPQSFDDYLKEPGNQAEFDRRVQRAIDTALEKAQESWKAITDGKISEAEKLAKMSAAEKAKYQEQQRAKELDEREAALNRKELMATAKNTLADRGLPSDLAAVLDYSNAEACSKSIDAIEKAVKAGIEAGVKARIQGGAPMKKAPENAPEDDMKKKVYDAVKHGLFN